MDVKFKIEKSKVELILTYPFFGIILTRFEIEENNHIPTFATDGKKIYYNPSFAETLTLNEVISVLAHEIMHIVLLHCSRINGRDNKKWNIAADYVINLILSEENFTLPENCLYDKQYENMTAEEVYNILPETPSDYVSIGDILDNSNLSEEEKEKAEREIKKMVNEAKVTAKMAGKLSASMDRLISDLTESKVDWKEAIHTFVSEVTRDDYSFKRPNLRYINSKFYIPMLHSEKMKPILLGIDTSGSIDDKMLSIFGGHLQAIQEQRNVDVNVVYIDANVNKVEYFEVGDDIRLSAVGGGGTDFRPLFEYYNDDTENDYSCIIYLTDMEGTFPDNAPDIPVLWVTDNKNVNPPFGLKVIF